MGCACTKERKPTSDEFASVQRLVKKAQTQFDPDNVDSHMELLKDLWGTFHDNVRGVKKPFERVSSDWQKIGFQNEDPVSDIRGGGLLAIEQMLNFIRVNPDLAIAMAEDREQKETSSYLPWATAGVNVTRLLLEMFGAVSANGYSYPKNVDQRSLHFWNLIFEFDALYILVFRMLDATFESEHGDYMSFQHIKATVLHRVLIVATEKKCQTVLQLEEHLRRRHWANFRKLSLPADERERVRSARKKLFQRHVHAVLIAQQVKPSTSTSQQECTVVSSPLRSSPESEKNISASIESPELPISEHTSNTPNTHPEAAHSSSSQPEKRPSLPRWMSNIVLAS